MPAVAEARPVIFCEFILRGVEPFVSSVLFATNFEVLTEAFIIVSAVAVIAATVESTYPLVAPSLLALGVASETIFYELRLKDAVGAVMWSNVVSLL